MTKRCVRIVYRSKTDEKEVKMGRVGLLPNVSRTQVKTHIQRQDPVHAGPFPHTQSLKNTPAHARTELHTHEYKIRTQARAHARKNKDRSSSSTFSKMHHPKSILDMF